MVYRWIKQLGWLLAVFQSVLIIASRKYYTVDVVVAWYTVNLVVFFVDKNLPEIPDRSSVGASLLLAVSNKDKDSWNKEENRKLLNGNSVEPMDRVCRSFQSQAKTVFLRLFVSFRVLHVIHGFQFRSKFYGIEFYYLF
ncbi:hypothetical protein BVRB_5g113320 [Beta vulgaris subsp. vulgaris]|nr:hypothetical protein BVRB_5g113320 [Beta vulgaris subsp. vulgaris]